MRWVDNSAGSMDLCLIWGSGQLLIVSMFLGKYRSPKYYSSGSCLRNSLCTSSGPTAEWLDFFMESTSSVRVNGLLYSSELFEENFIFFFSRVGLIL